MDRRKFLSVLGGAGVGLAAGREAVDVADAQQLDSGRGSVEVVQRDKQVSHVYADTLYAGAYGNGYVQASERLFQMDALRLIARGRAATTLGEESQLIQDITNLRDLYSEDELREMYENADPEARTALEGFAAGVNDRMEEGLPGEYIQIRDPPRWTPLDSVAVIAFLIGVFGYGGGNEFTNARTLAQLKQSLGSMQEAYRAYEDHNWLRVPDTHTPSIPQSELEVEGGEEVVPFEEVPEEQLRYVDAALGAEPWGVEGFTVDELFSEGETASNAAVVSGEHTATGKPMMFGGPQMGYFKPSVVFEIGLHIRDFGADAVGGGIVGAPGVLFGRTQEFAWTVTSGRDDHVDTIVVELDPDDRHRYRWKGEWHRMETRTVTHSVGDRTFEQEIARIVEGDVVMPVVAWNPTENVAWARRTTTRGEELSGAFHWVNIDRKNDLDGFLDAVDEFPFSFNILYADHEDIAMVHTGKVPERPDGQDHRLPVPPELHEWRGTVQGRDLGIEVVNPSKGYITSWNNAPVAGWRASDTEQQWGSIHRNDFLDDTVERYIRDHGPLSFEDVQDILREAANHHPIARHSVPRFIDVARASGDSTLEEVADELERWRDKNYGWADTSGGRYGTGGMAIWEEVRKELQTRFFRDELGGEMKELVFDPGESDDPHAADHGRTVKEVTFVDALEGRTSYPWGDDVDATVREALGVAADTLSGRFGSRDPSRWRMKVRKSEFTPIGIFNRDPFRMVNRGTWNHVVALGKGLNGSKAVLAPSNTGWINTLEAINLQLFGKEPDRVSNQMDLYRDFRYKPLPITRSQVERVARDSYGLDPVPLGDEPPGGEGVYRLTALHSGKVLDVEGASTEEGADVVQWRYNGGENQHWRFEEVGGTDYRITAVHSGLVLDVEGAKERNGADVVQWGWNGGRNQRWRLIHEGNDVYRLMALHSGKALDVSGKFKWNGVDVHQWEYVGGRNQRWRLEKID